MAKASAVEDQSEAIPHAALFVGFTLLGIVLAAGLPEESYLPMLVSIASCWALPALMLLQRSHRLLVHKLMVEMAASALFKFLVNLTVLLTAQHELSAAQQKYTTLLTVWTLITFLAFPSGGHLNSALSFAFWTAGQLPFAHALLYATAQLGGCALAMETLRLWPSFRPYFGALTPPTPSSSALGAMGLEVVFTGLNTLLGIGCGIFGRHAPSVTASLVIVLILVSNACMDPSSAFASALFARDSRHLQLYWAGGLLGGALGGWSYRLLTKKA